MVDSELGHSRFCMLCDIGKCVATTSPRRLAASVMSPRQTLKKQNFVQPFIVRFAICASFLVTCIPVRLLFLADLVKHLWWLQLGPIMPSDVFKPAPPLIVISGGLISHLHTALGLLAFLTALVTALCLHYEKVVKNHVAQYPQEWWPSVSATIGDWYPERNLFQVGIALMAGPRFALVFLSALLVSLSAPSSSLKTPILLFVGVLRTLACGGWVYVTSTDDHQIHDIAMFLYLALTPPWMYITSGSLTRADNKEPLAQRAKRMRRIAASSFFACTPFMGFFFYRHNVLRIPGAYSHYAYFEWGLIIFVSANA